MSSLTPDQVLAFVLLDLTLILLAARLMGALARRVGQPGVVGEIVAGILLGPTLLGPTVFRWDSPWSVLHCDAALAATGAEPSISSCLFPPQARGSLSVLGQVGLMLFMFLVGLQLDHAALRGRAKSVLTLGLGAVGVPVVVAFLISPVLFSDTFVAGFGTADQPSATGFSLFVAAMLSVTAFPVMARILQEKGLSASAMGAVGVAAAAVVTVAMFLLVAVARGVSAGETPGALALVVAQAAAYLLVMWFLVRPALAGLAPAVRRPGPLDPGVFAVLFLVLLASAATAHVIGINVIVGGFVAGAVMPARAELFGALSARLSDLTAVVLLPVFLAFSGLNTDFTTLRPDQLGGIAVFLLAGVVAKCGGGALFARLGGLTWREGTVLGVLMNCRGLLVLVVALIGVNAGVITPALQIGGVLMALVTTVMTGPLVDRAVARVPAEPAAAASRPSAAATTR